MNEYVYAKAKKDIDLDLINEKKEKMKNEKYFLSHYLYASIQNFSIIEISRGLKMINSSTPIDTITKTINNYIDSFSEPAYNYSLGVDQRDRRIWKYFEKSIFLFDNLQYSYDRKIPELRDRIIKTMQDENPLLKN